MSTLLWAAHLARTRWGDVGDWIGARLSIESSTAVAISITAQRLDELRQLVQVHFASNTLSLRKLRAFVGKCQRVASVLYAWRPFVHMM